MRFEWDPAKAESNRQKHGVTFESATLVFLDEYAWTEQNRIEGHEYRWQTIGLMSGVALLLVVHVDRDEDGEEIIRIISARYASRAERRRYEQSRAI